MLLFHLKNHYALIFAAREYTDLNTGMRFSNIYSYAHSKISGTSCRDALGAVQRIIVMYSNAYSFRKRRLSTVLKISYSGTCVRQILTARKGQRPTAWLDFEEVRQVMLGWDGYKIMCISSSVSIDVLRNNLLTPAVNADGDNS